MYDLIDLSECWRVKGKAPIRVWWVDVDKGFGVNRSRLVAKDFRPRSTIRDREGLFAAMPPLEAVKLLLAKVAADYMGGAQRKFMFIDIGKAHLHGHMETDEFGKLPVERKQAGKCAKLRYTLYGMRMAATNWEKEHSRTLQANGFVKGLASSAAFFNSASGVRIIVHGDDLIMSGARSGHGTVHDMLKEKDIVKMRGLLGPGREDAREVVVLSRVFVCDGGDFRCEADPPTQNRGPGAPSNSSVRRRAGSFLAQDRPDIMYTVREL